MSENLRIFNMQAAYVRMHEVRHCENIIQRNLILMLSSSCVLFLSVMSAFVLKSPD